MQIVYEMVLHYWMQKHVQPCICYSGLLSELYVVIIIVPKMKTSSMIIKSHANDHKLTSFFKIILFTDQTISDLPSDAQYN